MGNCLPKFFKKENPSDTNGMGAKVRLHLLTPWNGLGHLDCTWYHTWGTFH